ncbi:UrcA family protein [Novosphingobium sp.]|uniref:UrcA family protein n=1 Tax=Novosphingobium sp. TaxID=1874826 RepID=UPI0022C3B3DB|nr:UrcA family protein [Novosphingobium sp.]MCZ8018973.1 UrcA family protein [Novosphingobium sp.]MCZ8034579.1 UrcA family protein [Novosphingobium sp.]MCZ8052127.1 UrcA family protein [Novosphingobium sp.]MCZ8060053.1 UrcA family protein [Novosphingobium sp.]MCZ8231015.1 UrcA family protein [Novosphingobium sp.]
MNRMIGTSLGLLAACLAAPAVAGYGSALVTWSDLDLASPSGRATLEQRIDVAANQACKAVTITGSRIPSARERDNCKVEVRRELSKRLIAAQLKK